MANDNVKKHIIVYVLIITAAIIATIAVSYAIFTKIVSGNDLSKNNVITAGIFDVEFENGQYIDNAKMYLINDDQVNIKAPYTSFKIKHSDRSNLVGNYSLYLSFIELTDNLKSEDVKWRLSKIDNENEEILNEGNLLNAKIDEDLMILPESNILHENETHSYVLRLWYSNDDFKDQIYLLNGKLNAKVKLVSGTIKKNQ